MEFVCPSCGVAVGVLAVREGVAHCPGCGSAFAAAPQGVPPSARRPPEESVDAAPDRRAWHEADTSADQSSATEAGRKAGTEPADIVALIERAGPYEVSGMVARGGMGVVYRARDRHLGRQVAIKVLRSDGAGPDEVRRFRREAEAAARLQHSNIVPIHAVGSVAGRPFFVMDFIEGRTLLDLIRAGELSPRAALDITEQTAEALHYAHAQGVIHRDLKPANIIVDRLGRPQVMDFGLAKHVDDDMSLTKTGTTMGTPAYMPPEQAEGDLRAVDEQSDVYSLGAVLYEMLTGRAPFQGSSTMNILMKVLDEDPVPPRRINPRIHRDVETVCLKAMAKEKSERYRTAREFAEDIRRFRAGEAISAAPAGAFHRAGRFLSRHRTAATVSIVLLVALGPTVAYFLRRYRHEQEASRIAEAAKMSDRLASASGKVDEARRLHAEGVPDWRSRAQALFEKAMDDVRAVLARQPDQPEAAALMRRIDDARREVLVEDLLDLAHGFLDANQNVAAEKLFRWLIDYDPDNAAAREGMRLALGVGRLSLRTSPPGVEAALAPWDSPPLAAGEPIGRTPLNGAAVGIGRHRLVLSSPGTGRHELPLEVARSAAMDLGTVNLPRMADAGDGMVLVPAGEVTLFDGRRARVEAFAVDRYESGARLGEVPRRGMSWVEAAGACRAKGKRLCSFLEWRRACAGEASLVFPYGNRFDPGRCWTGGADATSAGPAGGRAGCVSPWGVYDMSGNVSEWTGKQASDAAVYGGDWSQIEGALLGCGSDSYPPLDRKAERAGFRCCVDSTAP